MWSVVRRFRTGPRLPDAVVGVASNIDELVRVINMKGARISDRISAAELVRSSIEGRAVSSVQELWYASCCLLDLDNPTELRRAGWRLLISCISHDDLNNGAFSAYYNTIITQANVEDFDIVLEAIKKLTDDGKHLVSQPLMNRLPVVLIDWIQLLAVRAQKLRADPKSTDVASSWGSSTSENFHTLMQFTIQTLKFSMSVFEPLDLEELLLCVVVIIRNTSDILDAREALAVIDTVMAYGILPAAVLQPVLEALCGLKIVVKELSEPACTTIRNIGKSHLGFSSFESLRCILETSDPDIMTTMRIGAAEMLVEVAINSDSRLVLLLESLSSALPAPARLRETLAQCLSTLLTSSELLVGHTIFWSLSGASPLDLINSLAKTGTSSEEMGSLLDALSALLDGRSAVPIDPALEICLDLSAWHSTTSALKVVEALELAHYCSPFRDKWQERVDRVLDSFYNEQTPSVVRKRVLKLMQTVYALAEDDDNLCKVTDRLFTDIDPELCEAQLELYEYLSFSFQNSHSKRIATALLHRFPSRNREHSEANGKIATALARQFAKCLHTRADTASFLFESLVEICKNSLQDSLSFRNVWAPLCRLRADYNGCLMFTRPTREEAYGANLLMGEIHFDYIDNYDVPSLVLKCHNDEESETGVPHFLIDTSLLLDVTTLALEQSDEDVLKAVLVSAAWQLSNYSLFKDCDEKLIKLRNLALSVASSGRLPFETKHRADFISVIIHILTVLVPCHVFNRNDHDRLVATLVQGMNNWDSSCHWAIHCLVVCCYECSGSVQRLLPQILSKFQTKITTRDSSMFILDFLLSLSLVPWLTDNFTQQDYKRVFGMCFTYIQNSNYILQQNIATYGEIAAQHAVRMAYSTICYLFLSLDISARPAIVPYIVRNLVLADNDERHLDPFSMAIYDMIGRFTYSELSLTLRPPAINLSDVTDNPQWDIKRWFVGYSIHELVAHRGMGYGTYTVRRPTGTLVSTKKPALNPSAPLGATSTSTPDASSPNEGSKELFNSNFWMLESALPLSNAPIYDKPIPIPLDKGTNRAIAALDRAPVVDFHKVGIMYVAPGQTQEAQILANSSGSMSYRLFLRALGKLVRLRGNTEFYAGGLDTHEDMDGEYAVGWRSQISQLIFHVTTMMPTEQGDISFASKKRHIGNNFVNIYFDESGREFDFGVVPSQFNFINIVIMPTYSPDKWRIRAYHKEDLVNGLTAYEVKVVSEENLGLFVRNLALKANQYAAVHTARGEYKDNWVYRLQLAQQLRDRVVAARKEQEKSENEDSDGEEERSIELADGLDFTKSFL